MRKIYLLLALLYVNSITFAQNDSTCLDDYSGNNIVDSFSFEHSDQPYFLNLLIDTSFANNIWQIGSVQKSGFPAAYSGTRALQTDTLASYPVNNESAALIYFDNMSGSFDLASLTFWHYYDTDSLTDSCILQTTLDSGKTWNNIFNQLFMGGGIQIYYNGSLNNYQGNLYNNVQDSLFWSGKSNGWVKESICVHLTAVKGVQIPQLYGFRFLFRSDSVENNKPGWMIDNIVVRDMAISASISEKNRQSTSMVYPNPSASGIFHIDYPSHYEKGTVNVYNFGGQLLKSVPLQEKIDISELKKGIYYYRITFDGTGQVFSGSMLYE